MRDRRYRSESKLYASRDQVDVGRAGGLVRDMYEIDARHLLEELAREVLGRAHAGGAVGERSGLRLRKSDQLLYAARGHRRMREQDVRRLRELGDRRELRDRVVRHFRMQRGIDR